MLVDNLPSDAAIHSGWGINQELSAQTVEALDRVQRQVAALSGDKKVKRWKLLRLPRPEAATPKKKANPWIEFARGLARQIGGDR